MLRFRKGQYVKTTMSLNPQTDSPVQTRRVVPGDVLKILLVGPFVEGDTIHIDKTGHNFRVAPNTKFDYFCEVCKFPDCYTALDDENVIGLADFRSGGV